ncbi:MAG: hypothetical protein ACPL3P_07435 [Anaerolineales bacterium]
MAEATITQDQFELLMGRLDRIESYLAAQQKQAEELEELKRDLIPIGNHMIKVTIDELAEIGSEFRVEDLFFLFKRLLRDTHLLLKALDQLELLMGLSEEINRLMKPIFNTTVEELDKLEQEGFFNLAKAAFLAVRRIANQFAPQDVDIFATEISGVLAALRQPPTEAPSLISIMREMNEPQLRIGLARTMNMLKALGNLPENQNHHNQKGV